MMGRKKGTGLPNPRSLNYFSEDCEYRGWQSGASPRDMRRLLEELSRGLPQNRWRTKDAEDYLFGLSELSAIAAIAHDKGQIKAFDAVCALTQPIETADNYCLPAEEPAKGYANEVIRLCTPFVDACASTVDTLPEPGMNLDERDQPNASIHNLPEIVRALSSLSVKFNKKVFESPHIRVAPIERDVDAVLFKPDDGPKILVLGDVVSVYSDNVQAVQAFGGLNPDKP